ncbi:unnamed protein product [Prorocentrum cordatum]|uniref:Solute carrier family 40 protein n=1 Tax=Prorocentrum cordatum TaxID=2364126 RepID=A0ABN9W8Y9_9DINO|nr:unnamed protein product [Polarella glacialis]
MAANVFEQFVRPRSGRDQHLSFDRAQGCGDGHCLGVCGYAGQFADGLLRRGFTCVQVRQLCTCVSLCISVMLLMLLASAPDKLFAGCCISVLFPCMSVCNAGFQAAYLDIGGKDSSLILAFGNMIATLPGIASPIYGAWVLEATGSWHCLFYSVACVQVFACVFFYKNFGVVQRVDFIKV